MVIDHVDRYKTFARRTSDDRISERAWLDISEKLGKMDTKKWHSAWASYKYGEDREFIASTDLKHFGVFIFWVSGAGWLSYQMDCNLQP